MEKVVQVVAWVLRVKNLLKVFLKTAVLDGEKDALAIFSQSLKNWEQHPKAGQGTWYLFFPIAAGLWDNEFEESLCYHLRDTMSAF